MEEAEKYTKPRLDDHPDAMVEAAGLFTDDLILEILSRLPARSLHCFKCVSVSWRNLIADPANRKKFPQTLSGFLYMTNDKSGQRHHFASVSGDGAAPFDPALPFLQPNKFKDMAQVDACNGLLLYLCSSKNMVNPWARAEDDCRFVVYRYSCTAGLAFDPAVSSHFHAFCFETYMTGVNIYSSQTGAWSRRDGGIVEKVALFFYTKGVFVNGMMYVHVIGNVNGISNEYVLLGMDMQGNVRKTIPMPYGRRFGTIGSSQGCLLYVVASVDDNNKIIESEIELWCLKDCDSLVLKHTASIDELMSITGEMYRVVGIHPDCDTIYLVSCGGDALVAYDMQQQKVGCILNLEKGNIQRFLPYVPLFSESLADGDGW
ncbi:hypothetical protein VPH35_134071 [Triticum aestivum]